MDKKACIFDMDGTLVDSMGYWRRLGREFLARKGVLSAAGEIPFKAEQLRQGRT